MVSCLMAVPGHKEFPSWFRTGRHCCQNPCRTSVDQKISLLCPEDFCPIFLSFLQDTLCMVEIIESRNLRNIFQIWIFQIRRHCLSFMPRHMKGIGFSSSVFIQFSVQIFSLTHYSKAPFTVFFLYIFL